MSESNTPGIRGSVFIATSLDGYIAREDGGLDWLPADGEVEDHGYDEFISSVDALVMGRHSYEKVMTFGAWPYGEKPVVVLSSRPADSFSPPVPTVEFMSGPPREIAARLESRGMWHLYIDGGVTIQRFLDARLIQRLIITRIPVILGAGIPLFGSVRSDIRLRHVETRDYPSGLVQSEYEVLR